jgi:predicted DNA-binding transcriptional regulator AlpA
MMRRPTAAAYCDMKVPDFEREVASGRLPTPVFLGGEERWSRAQLDGALERLTGDNVPDWRPQQPLYSGSEGWNDASR